MSQWHLPANYDDLLDEPEDGELCDQHNGQPRPCQICRLDYWEARAEAMREEGEP